MTGEFVHLKRDTPWSSQIGCSFLLGLFLVGFAGALFVPVRAHWAGFSNDWGYVVFIAVFGGIGVLLWFMGVHQWLARRVPETEVEVAHLPVRPGERVALRIRQPGPVVLKSLRGRLLCEVQVWHPSARSAGTSTWDSTYPHDERIFSFEKATLAAGECLDRSLEFALPPGARPSHESPQERVRWRIEVWGRVRRWPDFMHPFRSQVGASVTTLARLRPRYLSPALGLCGRDSRFPVRRMP